MSYNYEYPYVDLQKYNDDWILHEMKDLRARQKVLEEYVKTYFDNLNLQDEVDNKIDAMAQAGYFDTIGLNIKRGTCDYRGKGMAWLTGSWGLPYTDAPIPHPGVVMDRLGVRPLYNASAGAGFTAQGTLSYSSMLAAMQHRNDIAYVVLEVTPVDYTASSSTLYAAMDNALVQSHKTFPNAQVIFIIPPGKTAYTQADSLCYQTAIDYCVDTGERYIGLPYLCLGSGTMYLNEQETLFTEAGQRMYAAVLLQQFYGNLSPEVPCSNIIVQQNGNTASLTWRAEDGHLCFDGQINFNSGTQEVTLTYLQGLIITNNRYAGCAVPIASSSNKTVESFYINAAGGDVILHSYSEDSRVFNISGHLDIIVKSDRTGSMLVV